MVSARTVVSFDTPVICLLQETGACDGSIPRSIAGWLLRGVNMREQKLLRALEDEAAKYKILSNEVLRTMLRTRSAEECWSFCLNICDSIG